MCSFNNTEQLVILKWINKGEALLTEAEKKVLENRIHQLKLELESLNSTDEFYAWRDSIKIGCTDLAQSYIKNNHQAFLKKARNALVLKVIDGNHKWEMIYDWARFQRIIDSAASRFFSEAYNIEQEGILSLEEIKSLRYNEFQIIHNYLMENGIHKEKLWSNLQKSAGISSFHRPQSLYEVIARLYKSEIDWPISVLYEVLQDLNLNRDSIMYMARTIESYSNRSIRKLQSANEEKKYFTYIQSKYVSSTDESPMVLQLKTPSVPSTLS